MHFGVIINIAWVALVVKLSGGVFGNELSCSRMQEAHLWTQHGNNCYLVRADPFDKYSFDEGRAYCQDRCSDYVTPNSEEENQWVWKTYKDNYPPENMWLGCTKPTREWVCTGDTAGRKYRNWYGVEPSEPVSKCVVMRIDTGKWHIPSDCDKSTPWPKRIMCEAPAEPPIYPLRVRCNAVATPIGKCPAPVHTVKVTSPMQCCLACAKQCNCRSFSLVPGSPDCRMNLGKINDPITTLTDQTCEYYEYEVQK